MLLWVFIGVLTAALLARALRVPGAVTWTLLTAVIVWLLVDGAFEAAALAGVAGLLGLGSGLIVSSLRRGEDEER